MQKITPFLWFDKQCEEAINFYTSIFPQAKIESIMRYPAEGLEGPMAGMEGKIRTVVFELFGQRFMALDGGPYFKPSGAVSFFVECEDQKEVDAYWDRLTEGGDPQAQQCGWLQDKFGFSWQIIPKALPELLAKDTSGRVMQAMLGMKKIDVAGLQKAAEGNI